jgi:hypothetical protein
MYTATGGFVDYFLLQIHARRSIAMNQPARLTVFDPIPIMHE